MAECHDGSNVSSVIKRFVGRTMVGWPGDMATDEKPQIRDNVGDPYVSDTSAGHLKKKVHCICTLHSQHGMCNGEGEMASFSIMRSKHAKFV